MIQLAFDNTLHALSQFMIFCDLRRFSNKWSKSSRILELRLIFLFDNIDRLYYLLSLIYTVVWGSRVRYKQIIVI